MLEYLGGGWPVSIATAWQYSWAARSLNDRVAPVGAVMELSCVVVLGMSTAAGTVEAAVRSGMTWLETEWSAY